MNYSSRHKLNSHHLVGSIFTAAIFSALTGSVFVFIVIAGALIAVSVSNGEVRIKGVNKR